MWWDKGKKVFRIFFIKKSKEEVQKKKDLYQKLNARLQVLFRFSKEGVELDAEIERTKEESKRVLEERGKQIIFNARVKDLEEDEKCSKYFIKKIVNKKTRH